MSALIIASLVMLGSLGGYDEAVKIVAEIKPKTLAQL